MLRLATLQIVQSNVDDNYPSQNNAYSSAWNILLDELWYRFVSQQEVIVSGDVFGNIITRSDKIIARSIITKLCCVHMILLDLLSDAFIK